MREEGVGGGRWSKMKDEKGKKKKKKKKKEGLRVNHKRGIRMKGGRKWVCEWVSCVRKVPLLRQF